MGRRVGGSGRRTCTLNTYTPLTTPTFVYTKPAIPFRANLTDLAKKDFYHLYHNPGRIYRYNNSFGDPKNCSYITNMKAHEKASALVSYYENIMPTQFDRVAKRSAITCAISHAEGILNEITQFNDDFPDMHGRDAFWQNVINSLKTL